MEYGAATVPHLEENDNSLPIDKPRKESKKQKRAEVVEELRSGRSPLDILNGMTEWNPAVLWAVVEYLRAHHRMHDVLEVIPNTFCVWFRELCKCNFLFGLLN